MTDAMDRRQPRQRPKRRRIARTLRPGETLVTDEGVEVQVVGKSRHPGSVRVVVTLPIDRSGLDISAQAEPKSPE